MSFATLDTDVPSQSGAPQSALQVALVGNPNSGKTTLFNALTGLRQKVGNYPGVTVEKKEGRIALPNGQPANLIDLPGLYSLVPHSPDEEIAREVLLGLRADTPAPNLIVNTVDASNLERNLYLTSQLLDIGIPVVIALTMSDDAALAGIEIPAKELAERIGVPVIPITATKRIGLIDLLKAIQSYEQNPKPTPVWEPPAEAKEVIERLKASLQDTFHLVPQVAQIEAVTLLMQEETNQLHERLNAEQKRLLVVTRESLASAEIDFPTVVINARYQWIAKVVEVVKQGYSSAERQALSSNEKFDRVLLHPFWGYVVFFAVMILMFQSIFSWAQIPMDWIKSGIDHLGQFITAKMPSGDLRELLVGGVLGGVGNTLVFLPQILLLFFFVSLLEDTGYMARAAFLMDKLMSKVGLHGKSFIPLLSSFACAIPAIMATRTIGDRKARLITILVSPLMSCSARLPVYALMIGAFIPNRPVLHIGRWSLLTLPGVTLICLYFLGMITAFTVSGIFHKTLLKGVSPTFLLELPPYRLPSLKTAALQMIERAMLFLKRAGTVILAVTTLLWCLTTYPRHPELPTDQRIARSFAGRAGHLIEPLIRPLGFDWKMGVGIVASFVAREVFVSAMGTVYNVDNAEEGEGRVDLQRRIQEDVDPRTGKKVFTPLVAVSLMVYYVLAMQCISTIAVVRRETNGWKWPLFQIAYMTGLAWVGSFIVFQVGRLLGWG